MKTKFDVSVWHHKVDGLTYALPMGATDMHGMEIYPMLNHLDWEFMGTLPKGMPVTDRKEIEANKVKCRLGGTTVITADWAVTDA